MLQLIYIALFYCRVGFCTVCVCMTLGTSNTHTLRILLLGVDNF